ncbi:type II toxin-antitoxin system Phd/YefM family antitoxin [Propioniciclava soli]|uniref:Antitoxin n=1 Tax=Propioniciclava soli TaxID=2775081 RepID=A0ABZ3C6W6_9ACTN|nr:type II toxin-antitoxin system prevent-host-death family antitoxin [Propioniciclava soli]
MSVPISVARAQLAHLVEQVEAGDEVVLTRHGRPVAVMVHPSAIAVRRADAALAEARSLRDTLASARAAGVLQPRLSEADAQALVVDVRRGRDG